MTGKEEKPIMIIRNLTDEEVVRPHMAIANQLQKEKDELEVKLTKYEMAFKILINHGFKIGRNISMEVDFGICFKNCVITGQEYELLEELMKGENS